MNAGGRECCPSLSRLPALLLSEVDWERNRSDDVVGGEELNMGEPNVEEGGVSSVSLLLPPPIPGSI
jgi:hypothetical protein